MSITSFSKANRRRLCAVTAVLVTIVPIHVFGQAAAKKGHPLIKPYEGSTISEQEVEEFTDVELLVGGDRNGKKTDKLEGKLTLIVTDDPQGRSTLEKEKNYEAALTSAGFQMLIVCSESGCPEQFSKGINNTHEGGTRYLTAKLKRAEGDVWIALKTGSRQTRIVILEAKPMDTRMVTVDAAALKNGLETDGHIAVYGIVFDTGKATLKPESAGALQQVKALMDANPQLKLYVVGHTDDVGDAGANMTLSNERAAAVLNELTTKYGVVATRLRAMGVGPYVPIASNRVEAGRAKNRRVELVEMR